MLVPLLIGSRAQGVHNAWSSGGEHGIRVSPMGPAIEHLARAMEPEFRRVFQQIPGVFFSIFPVFSDPWAYTKVVVHKLLSNFY